VLTPRGVIRTPAFMPVGTVATVKALYPDQVKSAGADILLGNTYHLMLRPGADRVARLGGLHQFMGWDGPILTDSGGFQVMSLSTIRKITEEGVAFQSHLDGSKHMLSPERSIEIQCLLGSDIQMQFDECIELPAERKDVERAVELSLRWAERSKRAFEAQVASGGATNGQSLFAIVQGGTDIDLRKRSADALVAMDFPGYAVGGLAVGEGHDAMIATLSDVVASARTKTAI
jgi:queuine tRNA-ribosyltransferase